jgi:hypothetical protein
MRSLSLALLFLCAALGGCVGHAGDGTTTTSADTSAPSAPEEAVGPALVGHRCGDCREPVVAWDLHGRLFAVLGDGGNFSVSLDGGRSFSPLAPPPLPAGFAIHGDAYLQVDLQGRLWWSAIAFHTLRGVDGGVQVARSENGGRSWAVDHVVVPVADGAPAAVDRQWLAFGPNGRVYLSCTCPTGTAAQLARSDDDGATFGAFAPITMLPGRPGPAGPLVARADGALLVPYLVGAVAQDGRVAAEGVAVSLSTDGGTTFTPHLVSPAGGPAIACCAWPSAAVEGDTFVVAWSVAGGSPQVSASRGGMAWSAPVAWRPAAHAVAPNAWVVANATALGLAWFEAGGDLWVARGGLEGPQAVERVARLHPNTDLPQVAQGPDGRYAVTWADGDFWVAVTPVPAAPQP